MLRWLQRALLYPRRFARPDDRITRSFPRLERWHHGGTEAWFLPADEAKGTVVHCHGNAELIDYWLEPLSRYRALGFHLLLVEYRGYGRSRGRPTEAGITEDVRAFHDRLVADRPLPVVGHGRSLGGGAILSLAEARPLAGLILESTFTSVPDVARDVLRVPRFLLVERFENHRKLRDFEGPVLLMHGTRDEVVPYAHAERNLEAARDATLVTYDCGHNDLPPRGAVYWPHLEALLARATLSP